MEKKSLTICINYKYDFISLLCWFKRHLVEKNLAPSQEDPCYISSSKENSALKNHGDHTCSPVISRDDPIQKKEVQHC